MPGHALVQGVELVVPLQGLIDVVAELEKLSRERGKLEQELARITAKLANEQFTGKAPGAVVAKEREKAQELEARLVKNQESITRMQALS